MKKMVHIGVIVLAVLLIASLVVFANNQDKAKVKKETTAVKTVEKQDCSNCAAKCDAKNVTDDSKKCESSECQKEKIKTECACGKSGTAECKAKHAEGKCTGHDTADSKTKK
jgi:hypothetical protein